MWNSGRKASDYSLTLRALLRPEHRPRTQGTTGNKEPDKPPGKKQKSAPRAMDQQMLRREAPVKGEVAF